MFHHSISKFSCAFSVLFCFLLYAGGNGALAAEAVEWAPAPDWVETVEIPAPLPEHADRVSGGVYYLLVSRQLDYDGSQRTIYRRYAEKIVNSSGLEGVSSLSISFRPDRETLRLHSLIVHRDGETIDLKDAVELHVFRQEDQVSDGVLDGRETAFANLPGIRVGDVVEYSYSHSFRTILMPDDFFAAASASYTQPLARLDVSMRVPEAMELQYRLHGFSEEPEIEVSGGRKTYRWSRLPPPIDPPTLGAPSWYVGWNFLEVSSIGSWADIAAGTLLHYPRDAELPAALRDRLEAIRAATDDRKSWVTSVLKLVQDDVRYVGIEIGDGAFVPRAPKTVYELGYGDCKDKAQLMATALRWLGIDAVPALVDIDGGEPMAERLPSPFAFNHVVVRVRLNGETYWLDPTLTLQDSADPAQSQVSYGYALPIAADATGLEKMEPASLYEPMTVVSETVTFHYGKDTPPFTLRVESRYKGPDADTFRRRLADRGMAGLSDGYLDYYDKLYQGVRKTEKMRVDEDGQGGVTVTEFYEATDRAAFDAYADSFPMRGDTVYAAIREADRKLDNPVALDFPLFREHRVTLKNLRSDLEPIDRLWRSKRYLDYSVGAYKKGRDLTLIWRLRTKRDHVKPDELRSYADVTGDIEDNSVWYYDIRPDSETVQN